MGVFPGNCRSLGDLTEVRNTPKRGNTGTSPSRGAIYGSVSLLKISSMRYPQRMRRAAMRHRSKT